VRRRVVSVPMWTGSWLRLECGHEPEQAAVVDGDVVDCPSCDRRRLPAGLRLARQTPIFTAATTPAGLRRTHRTTVWAELVVTAGVVELHEDDLLDPWPTMLTAGSRVTLVPDRTHSVTPSPEGEFYVRFYEPVLASPLPRSPPAPFDR
jgi:tellurite resistance-related uncharacterized protein